MTAGHIHTDRSRERRVNSARSDDSSYPKIKTPSRDDTLICSPTFDNESDLKAGLKTEPLSYDHRLVIRNLFRENKYLYPVILVVN